MTQIATLHLDVEAVPSRHFSWRGVGLKSLGGLLVVAGLFALFHFVLEPYIQPLEEFVRKLGLWAPLLYIAVFVIATTLFVPESILAIAAGAIFGLWMGLVWVVVAGMLSAIVIFVLARHLFRGRIEQLLESHPKIRAMDAAASDSGFRLMVLLRLSPLSFTLLSYLLAMSRARFRTYVIACIGMFPGNFSTVYIGYAAQHAATLAQDLKQPGGHLPTGDSLIHEMTLFLGLGAAIVASVVVARIAMREIRNATKISPEVMP
jgi:uncharacterized membrane protein YdjX (TVP38/TMEM64 family)